MSRQHSGSFPWSGSDVKAAQITTARAETDLDAMGRIKVIGSDREYRRAASRQVGLPQGVAYSLAYLSRLDWGEPSVLALE